MVGISTSCNPEKLRQVLRACRVEIKRFYGLTAQDKEEITCDVMLRFELDGGKYPATVYGKYCRNKTLQFIQKKVAQKRVASTIKNGVRVYLPDVSFEAVFGEDSEDELRIEEMLGTDEQEFSYVELLSDVQRKAPDLLPVVEKVIDGEKLTRNEKNKLRTRVLNEIPLY